MQRITAAVRRALLAIVRSEAIFLLVSFIFAGVLSTDALKWYVEPIETLYSYVIIPWGVVLCVLHLERAAQGEGTRADVLMLLVLLAWMIVPFALRFGATFNNISSWNGYAVAFVALYATVSEASPVRRAHAIDLAAGGFALLSFVMGGMLLFCAATGRVYGLETSEIGFGVQYGSLCSGVHYNITGMVAICCALMCLVGVSRRHHVLTRVAHLIPAVMMMVVVVLTQSRTARYSLLIALAAGTYAALMDRLPLRRAGHRHVTALVVAAMVLVMGYLGAAALTRTALAYYAELPVQAAAAEAPEAPEEDAAVEILAQADEEAVREEGDADETEIPQARAAVDATFSDRTKIWANLIALWRENPKYLMIGNGVGRTGSRIVQGTIHETSGAVAVHNTYLQFIADFGLIGFALLAAFFVTILRPVWTAFFARGEARRPGGRALGMLVIAALATGMMESAPLAGLTPMGMMIFFALGAMTGLSREQTPGL